MVHENSSRRAPGERVRQKRADRAEAIASCALEIVGRDGIDALTLARVGDALGYVAAALYRYYPSKDALLADLQRRALAEVERALAAAVADAQAHATPATEPLAALLAVARAYLSLPESHARAWSLIAVLAGDPRPLVSPEQSLRTAPVLLALLEQVRARFAAAAAARALEAGDALERTLALWSALHGALVLAKSRRVAPAMPTAERAGMAAARAMLLGWGADRRALARAEAVLDGRRAHPRSGRTR